MVSIVLGLIHKGLDKECGELQAIESLGTKWAYLTPN